MLCAQGAEQIGLDARQAVPPTSASSLDCTQASAYACTLVSAVTDLPMLETAEINQSALNQAGFSARDKDRQAGRPRRPSESPGRVPTCINRSFAEPHEAGSSLGRGHRITMAGLGPQPGPSCAAAQAQRYSWFVSRKTASLAHAPRRPERRSLAVAAAAPAGGQQQQAQQQRLANSAVPAPVTLPRVLRERDYGALDKSQFSLFVQFFRQASPYIEGHRGRTFVLAIPGEVGPPLLLLDCVQGSGRSVCTCGRVGCHCLETVWCSSSTQQSCVPAGCLLLPPAKCCCIGGTHLQALFRLAACVLPLLRTCCSCCWEMVVCCVDGGSGLCLPSVARPLHLAMACPCYLFWVLLSGCCLGECRAWTAYFRTMSATNM